ncbi:MAG: hypothetical protein ACJ8FY_18375 [Gemmataceae bacterium]
MRWLVLLDTFNLLHVFNYYLMLGFLISTVIRVRSYRAILGLIFTFPNRWPRLLVLVKKHRTVFLGWPTLLAIGLAFGLMLSNSLAIRLVWVQASVTLEGLWGQWVALAAIGVSGSLMLLLDCRAILSGGKFERAALEEDLDKAESWLTSWVAPALKVATLGFINPRKIVGAEVHKALVQANWIVIGGMWRSSLRIGMQLVFGLSLWLSWALALREPV